MSESHSAVCTVVVLGAGGYLGGALCRFFRALPSFKVVALFRGTPNHDSFHEHLVADVFAEDWAARILTGEQLVLINCAFDFASVGKGVLGSKFSDFERNVAALGRRSNVKLINISTMSAFPGCRTEYGREKLFIEDIFRRYGGTSIRPGLLVSWRKPGAAFSSLIEIVRGSRIIPLLTARTKGFHICDLEAAIFGIYFIATMKLTKPHTLSFCYENRLTLPEVVAIICEALGLSKTVVPVPWWAAYALLVVKERLIGVAKVRADSVLDYVYRTDVAFGRRPFARMISSLGPQLEARSDASVQTRGFYFLEAQAPHASRRAPGVDPDLLSALNQLLNSGTSASRR